MEHGTWNLKLQSFTILEIVIAMALSMFVVLIALSVFLIINKQLNNYTHRMEESNDLFELNLCLNNDLNRSDYALFEENDLIIYFDNSDSVVYQFDESFVSRNYSCQTDSFIIRIVEVNRYFASEIIDDGYMERMNIKVEGINQPYKLTYEKQYDANFYLNRR